MCGIFGIVNIKGAEPIDKKKAFNSAMSMIHRGPDAQQQWGIKDVCEFVHLRLSILDLNDNNNQPFHSSCGNYVITFNGEVFNYIELKEDLQKKGYTFKTTGDTEVVLNAYIEWGEDFVNKLNGMWAFTIYEITTNKLFCSRDRFGIKPFCYSLINNQFSFSSEIKSILSYYPELKEPNYNLIANFVRNSLGAQVKETWFENVFRLLPAHNLVIENGKIRISKYWDYPTTVNSEIPFSKAKNDYNHLFQKALKIRMRSDVPVGTTLSSGIDSSSIVCSLRKFYNGKHNTYTANFKNTDYSKSEAPVFKKSVEIDEPFIVKKLAEEIVLDAHFVDIPFGSLVKDLEKIVYHLESGNSSPAIIPLTEIMEVASKEVTVVLEGQGADELLGGYIVNVFPVVFMNHLKKGALKKAMEELRIFTKTYSLPYTVKLFFRHLNNPLIESIYHKTFGIEKALGTYLKKGFKRVQDYPLPPPYFDDSLNRHLFKSHTGGLVNLLHYGDAVSMSKSIESRLPFMDVNLVEYVFRLPFSYKVKLGLGKFLHRKSMEGIVPDFILNNPIKFGFNTPISKQFCDTKKGGPIDVLLSEKCLQRGIFNKRGLKKMIEDHLSRKKNNAGILFRFLQVELWFRTFID